MKRHLLLAIVISITTGLLSIAGAGTADAYFVDLVSSTSSYPPGSQIPGYGYNVDFMDSGPYPNFTFHSSISTYDATGTPSNGGTGTLGVELTTTAGAQIVTGIYGLGVYQGSGDETRINDGDSITLTFDSAVSLEALTIMFGSTDATDGFSLYADGSLIYNNVDIWTAGTQVWPAGWQVDLSGAVGTEFTIVGATGTGPGWPDDLGFLLAGIEVQAVPEAATLLLLGSGLVGIVAMRKRIANASA